MRKIDQEIKKALEKNNTTAGRLSAVLGILDRYSENIEKIIETKRTDKDITDLVEFGSPDDEILPLLKCVCGEKFDYWNFILGIYRETSNECRKCKRRMYFYTELRIFQVIDDVQQSAQSDTRPPPPPPNWS